MTRKLMYPLYSLNRVLFKGIYGVKRILNHNNLKLFVYTDSRGFYVNKHLCRKNPHLSYVDRLSDLYSVKYSICDFKHTTIFDFLYDYKKTIVNGKYDFIVINLGVVDFSPRPVSQVKRVLQDKRHKIYEVFGDDGDEFMTPEVYQSCTYRGEPTASLYSLDKFEKYVLPKINNIQCNKIWIGVNSVLSDWQGNYSKKRPGNMNEILEFQNIINNNFKGVNISLDCWTSEEVRKFTVDNIHYSLEGFEEIFQAIVAAINTTVPK